MSFLTDWFKRRKAIKWGYAFIEDANRKYKPFKPLPQDVQAKLSEALEPYFKESK